MRRARGGSAGALVILLALLTVVGALPVGATSVRVPTTPAAVPAVTLGSHESLALSARQPYAQATRYDGVDHGRLLTLVTPDVRPRAIVVVLPGLALDGAWSEKTLNLGPQAAAKGWLLVFPTGEGTSWDARQCCGYAADNQVDDASYLAGLLASLQQVFGGGARLPTIGLGFSNGAMELAGLACQRPGLFTAVEEVAGTLEDPTCVFARARQVVIVRSAKDSTVPVDGGYSAYTASHDLPDVVGLRALTNGLRCSQSLAAAGGVAEQRLVCGKGSETVDRVLQSRGPHGWFTSAAPGRVDDNAVAVALIQATVAGTAFGPLLPPAASCARALPRSVDELQTVLTASLAVRGHVGCGRSGRSGRSGR